MLGHLSVRPSLCHVLFKFGCGVDMVGSSGAVKSIVFIGILLRKF